MADSVPATVLSSYSDNGAVESVITIGGKFVPYPFPSPSTSGFWFAVVELSSLNVVATAAPTSNTEVPPAIQQYVGKEGYFLFFLSNAKATSSFPQGDLYTMLMNSGGGATLENMEQVVSQVGTGAFVFYSYILAGTLDSGDLPGFEAGSFHHAVTLPMQFVPIEVGGQTTYAPSRFSTP